MDNAKLQQHPCNVACFYFLLLLYKCTNQLQVNNSQGDHPQYSQS